MSLQISDEILASVTKPAQYFGNEWNSVHKDLGNIGIRFAFCFPDIYEIGMSHLGMKILYHILNERPDTFCERVFAPWADMEEKMRQNSIPLFALETHDPVKEFDIMGFTLQYEMSYTNIINMLDLSGVPIRSKDRLDSHPFVCAGGPCACNPETLAEIIDFFVIGEAEEVIHEILDVFKKWKQHKGEREDFLYSISQIEGVYVPRFYKPDYNEDGTLKSISPTVDGVPERIQKRIIKKLDDATFPDKIIVPFIDIVHDRVTVELFRGCIRGCRFCQAGFIYRPVRERSCEKILDACRKLIDSTGYNEISLASLSTSDYTELPQLTDQLIEEMEPKNVNFSLPSLRVDSFSLELMEKAQKVRKGGLTFAPEAGTQRLRDVINKGVTEANLLDTVGIAFEGGWNSVKLYFMLGLPTEDIEDVAGIADLGEKVVGVYRQKRMGKPANKLNVTISTSVFVPKPFTPFQWEGQESMTSVIEKQKFLKKNIKSRHISYSWHASDVSMLEAVVARGDRRVGEAIIKAWELGCKFDTWGEFFKFDKWLEAFGLCGIDVSFYANRKRSFDEVLPWDHIDMKISKEYLMKENIKAFSGGHESE